MPLPLTISTSWAAGGPRGLDGTVDRVLAVGGRSVELEYRIREAELGPLLRQLEGAGLSVRSLHNVCPHPARFDHLPPSGDLFRLSATDAHERALAVSYTLRTVRLAAELGADAVVLHLGNVGVETPATLRQVVDRHGAGSREARLVRERWLTLRAYRARPHLEAVKRALEPVVQESARLGVGLGLETRVHPHELPDAHELAELLDTFGPVVGYWHDTGHAEIRGRYGLLGQLGWLERFRDRLIGLHLTDVRGWEDHRAPGQGVVDFGAVARALPDRELVATLEIAPRWSEDLVKRGLAELARAGLVEAPALV